VEKPDPEGGGGFNPRIKPTESKLALQTAEKLVVLKGHDFSEDYALNTESIVEQNVRILTGWRTLLELLWGKMLNMEPVNDALRVRTIPTLLQREETAARIVALMMALFDRPGPIEMKQILETAEQQITALQLQPSPLS
jgi:hypothetical protein